MSGTEENDDLLAGEYVLGVLEDPERAAVAARAAREPALGQAIIAWENRLAPIAALVPPVAPPAGLWPRIVASCGLGAVPAPSPLPRPWQRLGFWRGSTAAGFALAAAIAAFAVLHRPPAPPPALPPAIPLASAVLIPPQGGAPFWLAAAGPNGAIQFRPLQHITVAAGHDLELWALPDGETVPRPLGLIQPNGRTITLPASIKAPMEIMVTLEQKGGSPSGRVQGPVQWQGHMAALAGQG